MSANSKRLKELEAEIARLRPVVEAEQRSCRHQWGPEVYEPTTTVRSYGSKFVGKGSDFWTEPERYREETVPRYKRECTLCNKVEYATERKTRTVTVDDGLDFR